MKINLSVVYCRFSHIFFYVLLKSSFPCYFLKNVQQLTNVKRLSHFVSVLFRCQLFRFCLMQFWWHFLSVLKCIFNADFTSISISHFWLNSKQQRIDMTHLSTFNCVILWNIIFTMKIKLLKVESFCHIFCLFVSSFAGCCFVTFYTRKAALKAQDALHNIKTLVGVSCLC